MAYFRIKQLDQPTKYIKSMDGANGTLEFTDNVREAMYRDMGFFADSDFEFIKFHFTKDYPELENMDIYDGYSDEDKCDGVVRAPIGGGWAIEEQAVAPGDLAVEDIGLDAIEQEVYNGFTYDVGVNVGVAAAAQ